MSSSGRDKHSVVVTKVESPSDLDVLLGRGAPVSEHAGNAALRSLVIQRQSDYIAATSRTKKHAVAMEICNQVAQQGGRFLQKGPDPYYDDGWIVVDDQKQIVNKVKQLLRDMAPEARQRRAQRKRTRVGSIAMRTRIKSTEESTEGAAHHDGSAQSALVGPNSTGMAQQPQGTTETAGTAGILPPNQHPAAAMTSFTATQIPQQQQRLLSYQQQQQQQQMMLQQQFLMQQQQLWSTMQLLNNPLSYLSTGRMDHMGSENPKDSRTNENVTIPQSSSAVQSPMPSLAALSQMMMAQNYNHGGPSRATESHTHTGFSSTSDAAGILSTGGQHKPDAHPLLSNEINQEEDPFSSDEEDAPTSTLPASQPPPMSHATASASNSASNSALLSNHNPNMTAAMSDMPMRNLLLQALQQGETGQGTSVTVAQAALAGLMEPTPLQTTNNDSHATSDKASSAALQTTRNGGEWTQQTFNRQTLGHGILQNQLGHLGNGGQAILNAKEAPTNETLLSQQVITGRSGVPSIMGATPNTSDNAFTVQSQQLFPPQNGPNGRITAGGVKLPIAHPYRNTAVGAVNSTKNSVAHSSLKGGNTVAQQVHPGIKADTSVPSNMNSFASAQISTQQLFHGLSSPFLSQQPQQGEPELHIPRGIELDPNNQRLVLQQLGIDPTPRREVESTQQVPSPTAGAQTNRGDDLPQMPQALQQLASASPSSTLLQRVQDFLPKIKAANSATTSSRIDTDLVETNGANEESSDADSSDDSDSTESTEDRSSAQKSSQEAKGIQFDLTLGVDSNHPVMAMLGNLDTRNDATTDHHDVEDDPASDDNTADKVVQRLLRMPSNGSTTARKGPLITEFASEDA